MSLEVAFHPMNLLLETARRLAASEYRNIRNRFWLNWQLVYRFLMDRYSGQAMRTDRFLEYHVFIELTLRGEFSIMIYSMH